MDIGNYLFPDIVFNLLKFLDKNNSFRFINASKFLAISKINLYNSYVFDHTKMKNSEIKKKVRYVKNININEFSVYENLWYVYNEFNLETIKNLNVSYAKFIKKIKVNMTGELSLNKFSNLTSLTISCNTFNQSLDSLPNTLNSLIVDSNAFNQSLDSLPNTLNELDISSSSMFNGFDISSIIFDQLLSSLPTANLIVINGKKIRY